MNQITKEEFIKNQIEYCKTKNIPFFMPHNGICFSCHRDIIPELIKNGQTGNSLITGCPLCHYSFVD